MRIVHIPADGTLDPNEATERRLVKCMPLQTAVLFATPRDPCVAAVPVTGAVTG